LGSGLLAKQPTPGPDEIVAVARVCPQCGGEYDTTDRFCPKDGTPLRPKAGGDPLIGRVIADRYLILALIGEGGMGRVYLAEHVKMNRQCAVKVMNPALIHDEESHQRFAREASSAARILHPNVAAVFDYGEADKIVYLVMEYVDGESISKIVAREGALDPRRAIDIARQVADGLQAAHELGIVHRDLKPDNIIVTRNKSGKEIPKVVDFGIAKAATDARQDSLTQSGLVIGTPEYMSPEQLIGDPVDGRSDIYSLGCILFQMLTARPAFAAESREQMIRRRLHEAPPHVRDVMPDLPRRLDTTIVHMLARSPKDRVPSAADARDALDPAIALGGWNPSNITVPSPMATMGPYRDDPSLQPTVPMPQVRVTTRRFAIGMVAASAVAAAAFAGWRWAESGRAAETALERPAQAAPPVAVKPEPIPDTLALSVDSINQRTAVAKADSIMKAAAKAAAAKPPRRAAVQSSAEAEFEAPLNRLTAAIGTKDTALVREAFPGMNADQERIFADIFANAGARSNRVRATATLGPTSISGTHASAPVTIDVFVYEALTPVRTPLKYVAHYERTAGRWMLTGLESTQD
jgi:serine/threonine-protein kinase